MGINASWYRKYLLPSFDSIVFFSNTLWYTSTAKCLVIYPFHSLRALTIIRPITYVAAELAQLYGTLRLGFSLFSIWGMFDGLKERGRGNERKSRLRRKLISAIVSITGVLNIYFGTILLSRGRWNGSILLPSLFIESILTVLNAIYALKY